MNLWDDKIKGKHNVRLARIYSFIKDVRFRKFIEDTYIEDCYIRDDRIERINIFIKKYDKYTNGKSKIIYKEIKKIRNEIIAHAEIDSNVFHTHSIDDLNEFYADTIKMIETAYNIFNIGITFNDSQQQAKSSARRFVAIMKNTSSPD